MQERASHPCRQHSTGQGLDVAAQLTFNGLREGSDRTSHSCPSAYDSLLINLTVAASSPSAAQSMLEATLLWSPVKPRKHRAHRGMAGLTLAWSQPVAPVGLYHCAPG